MSVEQDEMFMRQAMGLAVRGQGLVEPNPMVGATVVKNGQVVGEGYHQKFGGAHAEVFALRAAGKQARGGTLYVTLEPCCHFGKTPPCTDAIITAGIARVVCAMIDPFPEVRGKGIKILRKHGIHVDVGILAEEARDLNRAFIKRNATGKPYVIAKWAQSLDGAVATASGESKWISSGASRELVHILRGRMDAIVVGLGTVLRDDPLLTARPKNKRDIKRIAMRIVLDSQCHLPVGSQLARTAGKIPVILACASQLTVAGKRRAASLTRKGVTILPLPSDGKKNDRPAISHLLEHLHNLGHANVLVEGGPHVLGSFIAGQEVDEAHIFIAPKLIQGPHAMRPISGPDLGALANAPRLEIRSIQNSGEDVYIIAWAQNIYPVAEFNKSTSA